MIHFILIQFTTHLNTQWNSIKQNTDFTRSLIRLDSDTVTPRLQSKHQSKEQLNQQFVRPRTNQNSMQNRRTNQNWKTTAKLEDTTPEPLEETTLELVGSMNRPNRLRSGIARGFQCWLNVISNTFGLCLL